MDGLLGSEFALVLRDSLNSTPRRHVGRSPLSPSMPSPSKKPRSSATAEFSMPCDMQLEPRPGFAPIPTSPTSPLPANQIPDSAAEKRFLTPESGGVLRSRPPVPGSEGFGVRRRLSVPLADVGPAPLDVLAHVSAEQQQKSIMSVPTSPVHSELMTPVLEDSKKKGRTATKSAGSGRVFACKQCPSTFSQQFNLNKHVRAVHERRRPFECKTCHAKFQQKSHRTMHHLAVHEKLRQFACDKCSASFSWRGVLKKHRKSIHGIDE